MLMGKTYKTPNCVKNLKEDAEKWVRVHGIRKDGAGVEKREESSVVGDNKFETDNEYSEMGPD